MPWDRIYNTIRMLNKNVTIVIKLQSKRHANYSTNMQASQFCMHFAKQVFLIILKNRKEQLFLHFHLTSLQTTTT